jgi:acyl carrier protein phosphodiesterase
MLTGFFFAYIGGMNFLGHLYFSNNDHQLMYANLFGDFVRGKDLSHFPSKMEQGIHLHRMIDQYIDHHPAVIELLHKLYEPLPKVAGIAVDLYFDHLLAKQWEHYHEQPLDTFIDAFYAATLEHESFYYPQFKLMIERMKEKNWLYQYQFDHGLMKACQGVSSRISFPNVLDSAHRVFKTYEREIQHSFEQFMAEAIPHHSDYLNRLNG